MAKALPISARHFFALAGSKFFIGVAGPVIDPVSRPVTARQMPGADNRLPCTAEFAAETSGATRSALIFSPACSLITTKLRFECPLIALARTSLAAETDTETIPRV
jgi:hypothetical protein